MLPLRRATPSHLSFIEGQCIAWHALLLIHSSVQIGLKSFSATTNYCESRAHNASRENAGRYQPL
jgi:hypothetical protein